MKSSIIIVRPNEDDHMGYKKQEVKELYHFLSLVRGNWRNSVFIECSCGFGYLLTTDENAFPCLFPIKKFYRMTGEFPSKDECICVMDARIFSTIFSKWLLWNTHSINECGICKMYRSMRKR